MKNLFLSISLNPVFQNILKKYSVFGKESVKYVGKEVQDLESSKVLGVSNDSTTYENEQGKLYRIIEKSTLERAEQLGIPRRTYFDWKKKIREGMPINLKNKLKSILFSKYFEKEQYRIKSRQILYRKSIGLI